MTLFSKAFAEHNERIDAAKKARDTSRKELNMRVNCTPSKALRRGNYEGGGTSGKAIAKEDAIESEPYRRLVASLPCARCFVQGYSQAAHPPPTGKSRKEDDRACFPLCCTRPGEPGCHFRFDQYQLMPHDEAVEQAKVWGAQTRARIINRGLWPKSVPMWTEQQGATT